MMATGEAVPSPLDGGVASHNENVKYEQVIDQYANIFDTLRKIGAEEELAKFGLQQIEGESDLICKVAEKALKELDDEWNVDINGK